MKLMPGTQIAYVPNHAEGDIDHPDVEFGFVTSQSQHHYLKAHFCRYWHKGNAGRMRTKNNSELTPNKYIVIHKSVNQSHVNRFIKRLKAMPSVSELIG